MNDFIQNKLKMTLIIGKLRDKWLRLFGHVFRWLVDVPIKINKKLKKNRSSSGVERYKRKM